MANMPSTTAPSHRMTVSSLLSPPEMKRSESFGSSTAPSFGPVSHASFNPQSSTHASNPQPFTPAAMASPTALLSNGDAYASPPISPYETQSLKGNMVDADEQGARDPQLFPPHRTAPPTALEPLFPQDPASQAISHHMQSSNYARLESRPSRNDYELVVSFQSTVFELAFKDLRAWRARERRFENHYGRPAAVQKPKPLKKLAPAPSARSRQPKVPLARLPPHNPRKSRSRRSPLSKVIDSFDHSPTAASPATASPATASPATASPATASPAAASPTTAPPATAPRATAPPKPARSTASRPDHDFTRYPDYCPPLDTLPKDNPKSLKADWKGTVLDLSHDPHRHMLHEAELNLASTLRLNCRLYLCNKRRIFQARVEALRIGKEFRKTDAQQACKIDVNKASKLWLSYERVGWFNADFFRQYL